MSVLLSRGCSTSSNINILQARERWIDNFYIQRDMALSSMPYPLRVMVGYLIHRSITQTLHGQGVGRLSNEEIRTLKTDIWQSLDDVLKGRLGAATTEEPVWCLGSAEPTEADFTLFGFISSVLVSERCALSFILLTWLLMS